MARFEVFYKFQGNDRSGPVEAETSDDALLRFSRSYPQIKTAFKAERIPQAFKTVCDELSFSLTPKVRNFIMALLDSGLFNIEAMSKSAPLLENNYLKISGCELIPTSGRYNIAHGNKWGNEATITFDSTVEFPAEDFGFKNQKLGLVDSLPLFWSLIRMGFRIDGQHDRIAILKALEPRA